MIENLTKHLSEKFDYEIQNSEYFIQAFTHSSYANDYPDRDLKNLERLEFLGDSVLELCVSDYLFKNFQELPEGRLTQLRAGAVQAASLSKLTKEFELDKFILLGRGEEQSGGRERPALLEDVFGGFLGAVYLDQGTSEAYKILEKTLFPKIDRGDFSHGMDYKTMLQEFLQQEGPVDIKYEVVDTRGPDHNREFDVALYINGKFHSRGTGTSKKKAQQSAAEKAYNHFDREELSREEE